MVGVGEAVDDVEVAFVVLESVSEVAMVEALVPDKLVYLRIVLDVAIGREDGNLMGATRRQSLSRLVRPCVVSMRLLPACSAACFSPRACTV